MSNQAKCRLKSEIPGKLLTSGADVRFYRRLVFSAGRIIQLRRRTVKYFEQTDPRLSGFWTRPGRAGFADRENPARAIHFAYYSDERAGERQVFVRRSVLGLWG